MSAAELYLPTPALCAGFSFCPRANYLGQPGNEAIVGSAEQHLWRQATRKKWISDDTLELVELKHMAF